VTAAAAVLAQIRDRLITEAEQALGPGLCLAWRPWRYSISTSQHRHHAAPLQKRYPRPAMTTG
jgi:hypothetical protein